MNEMRQKIRPAARLIRTIGQDLIKDVYAAIVELVKNAYDADSPNAVVRFDYSEHQRRLTIKVEDCGHGMDFDTVVNKWLVPATDDKLQRKRSGKGRVLQGRKGIGRFAASVLGQRVLLETTQSGETTSLILDMDELETIRYLDEFALDVSLSSTGKHDGTIIEIERDDVSPSDVRNLWNEKQLHKLLVELRSLISPEEVYGAASSHGYRIDFDRFAIELQFGDFPLEFYSNRSISVSPFPVLDLFDYRITGVVDGKGNASLTFENQNVPSLPPENFTQKLVLGDAAGMTFPGEIYIDIRIYDRDPDSIENMIRRGLKDPDTGEYVGKSEARQILNEYYGVGIYREQFRIRPYGEQSFDWLELDKYRVQDPSRKLGHNQVIGFVYVRPEEESGLTEKSARDGLTENESYYGLKYVVTRFINEAEARRFNYRDKAMRGGRTRTLDEDINDLFDLSDVVKKLTKGIEGIGLREKEMNTVNRLVIDVLEHESSTKAKVARKVRDTLAVYQGQATLGKITHVLLHEGRKNLKYISETVPRLIKWAKELAVSHDKALEDKFADRAEKLKVQTSGLTHLFKKIEPLARTRRAPSKDLDLMRAIQSAVDIFQSELDASGIAVTVANQSSQPVVVHANEIDVFTVFSNLIENSIYWINTTSSTKSVSIRMYVEGEKNIVEYLDSGPGFQGGNLKFMFEPGYTMKPDGTGLGLALAGEAMARSGGSIEAKASRRGAMFEIIFR